MGLCLGLLAVVPPGTGAEDEEKEKKEKPSARPTVEHIKELEKSYDTERAAYKEGPSRMFSTGWAKRADAFAKQGAAALKARRLFEARDAFRRARWNLPSAPASMPANVQRIFGDGRLHHGGPIHCVAFNPAGTRLATASSDATVRVWDVHTGKELLTFSGHTAPVRALAWSPDGKWIASGGGGKEGGEKVRIWDTDIQIWNSATGVARKNGRIKGSTDIINSIAISADGKWLAAGGADRKVRIYEFPTIKDKHELSGHTEAIHGVAFSRDSSKLVSVGGDFHVRVWESTTGAAIRAEAPYKGVVFSAAFHPNSRSVLVGGAEPNVAKLLDAATLAVRQVYEGHTAQVTAVAISHDGKTVATGSTDRSIKLFDAANGVCYRTVAGHAEEVTSLSFSPDGTRLASASLDHTCRIWELGSTEPIRVLGGDKPAHDRAVSSAAYSTNNRYVVTAGRDKLVKVWDAQTGELVKTLKGHKDAVTCAVFSPKGKYVLSCGGDKVLKRWDWAKGQVVRTYGGAKGHKRAVIAAAFSPDGKKIVSGSADRTVKVWDTATGDCLQTLDGHTSVVGTVAWSLDGNLVASGSGDHTIKLYDAKNSMKELRTLSGHSGAVSEVAFSADSEWLVSGGGDFKVLLWSVKEGPPKLFLGHRQVVSSVAISSDGKLIASAGGDQVVKLWDVTTKQELHSYRGHKNWITSVAFSPDGHYLVSGSVDKTVRLYELGVQMGAVNYGHTKEVRCVAVSPDGKLLASGGADFTVRLWDLKTGKQKFVMTGHENPITAIVFLPDSKTLISSSETDKMLRIWDTETGKEKAVVKDGGPSNDVVIMTAKPGGKQFIAWIDRNNVDTFDAKTGKQEKTLNVQDKEQDIKALAFSPDATLAAVGDAQGKVRIMDIAGGKAVGDTITAHTMPDEKKKGDKPVAIADLALTPDKKTLITGAANGEIKIWDLGKRAAPQHTLKAHKQALVGFTVSADGKRFASVSMDNVVKLWSIDGKELRTWDFKVPYQLNKPYVRGIFFTPDGKKIATANGDTTLYLLECPPAAAAKKDE
jgi:WD40 repeat protein